MNPTHLLPESGPANGDTHDGKRAEEALRQTKTELRDVFENFPVLAASLLPEGTFEFVNSRWTEYTGLSTEELISTYLQSVIHPEDIQRHAGKRSKARENGEAYEVEARIRRADGEYRWWFFRNVPLRDEHGTILKWFAIAIDIDDRIRAEEAARRSERELRVLLENIPAVAFAARPDGLGEFQSRAWFDYSGLRKEDTLGNGWQTTVHPEDLESHVSKWAASVASGQPFEDELRYRSATGEYRWFLTRAVPLRDESGEIQRWFGVMTDIEDRKRAEETARRSEKELREIIECIPGMAWTADCDRSNTFVNKRWSEYTGISPENTSGSGWQLAVHPDDLEQLMRKWRTSLTTGELFEDEIRFLHAADGQYRWFLARAVPLRDENGKILKWVGILTDIEDRKRAENELKAALAQIKTLKDQLYHENVALREEIAKASMFEEIVGASPALQTVLADVTKVAPTDSTVLITGETGTGKELFARAIHKHSHRSSRAFVAVNCASIPAALIASELFGHEKGAFTGAQQRRLGRFELADGGTIFLDEVGELPLETQTALLRVLQEREFERVGGTQKIRCDVRVIAATNRDLPAAVAAGWFRRDLFYRLNVVPLELPPLRERKADIPRLVEYFIDYYAKKAGKKIRTIDRSSLERLQSYPWPGNIRELQNIIERSVVLCATDQFCVDGKWLSGDDPAHAVGETASRKRSGAREKDRIEAALAESNGKVSGPEGAAELLGLPPSTLETKIRALRINKFAFKKS